MKRSETERQEAIAFLRDRVSAGDTLYTVLQHVSRSGMQRTIGVFLIRDNEPMDVSAWAARAIGAPRDDKRGGVKVGGCGMDMGFHVVYELSARLYPDGFGCIGGKLGHLGSCPSNDHSNGDRDYAPHGHGDESRDKALGRHACPFCGSTKIEDGHAGHRQFQDGTLQRACRKCGNGWGQLNTHWHKDGGYAVRQRWM